MNSIDLVIDGHKWRVREYYALTALGSTYIVPKGSETNGPFIFGSDARIWTGAAVHDWLCSDRSVAVTRLQADKISFDLHEQFGVPRWKSIILFLGARAFGWLTWNDR